MMLNKATALTLRAGIVLGMILMVAGLIMSAMSDDALLYCGVLVLIASPLAGAVVTFLCLLRERDGFWATIAGILLIITIAGALISLFQ